MIRELKGKKTKNIVKRIRNDYDLTQDELAVKIYVSRQLISNWEKNNIKPDIEMMNLICKQLNISKRTLLFKYGYGREKLIRHCLNVILLALIGLLIVLFTENNNKVDTYVGNINDANINMTDTFYIASRKRKTLYLGSVLDRDDTLKNIRIYYQAKDDFVNVYEGKYKDNLRFDEPSNYNEYFKNNFDINNLFIDFLDNKNNVTGSYKLTFNYIPYQSKSFPLEKEIGSTESNEKNNIYFDNNKLLENGYYLEKGSNSIYVNGNYRYNSTDNILIYYDEFLYVELNNNFLTGEVRHFNKKTQNYDYGFYFDLKDKIICQFGTCNNNYGIVEMIMTEYYKLIDNANSD